MRRLFIKILMLLVVLAVVTVSISSRLNPILSDYPVSLSSNEKRSFQEVLQNRLANDLNELGIPALQVSVIYNDFQTDVAVGTIDYERRVEANNQHLFRVGSVTKLYTAVIIMNLIENGNIKIDDTLDKWFSDIPNADKITIRSMLNHTSGIYNYTESIFSILKTILTPDKVWKNEEIYAQIIKNAPYFNPGEGHYYSNSNYLLLGLIAEKVTGKDYSSLLQEIILTKLNLQNTFLLPGDKPPVRLVTGYDRDVIPLGINRITPANSSWASYAFSAGGIAANTGDIVKFLNALFSHQLLQRQTAAKMLEFHSFQDEDIPVQTGYGLGLRRIVIEDDTLVGHTGTIPGFGGAAFYCPAGNYYIAVLGNLSSLDQIRILKTIVKTIDEVY